MLKNKHLLFVICLISIILILICMVFMTAKEDFHETYISENSTIYVACIGNKYQQNSNAALLSYYDSQRDKIKIDVNMKDEASYGSFLLLARASGTMPDVFMLQDDMYDEYIYLDLLSDVGNIVEKHNLLKNNDKVMNVAEDNGKYYGVPIGLTSMTMVANVDILDRMNNQIPGELTWTELVQFGIEFKTTLNKRGFVLSYPINDNGIELDTFINYLALRGKVLVDVHNGIGFDVLDVKEYLEMYSELRKDGVIPTIDISVRDCNATPESSFLTTRAMAFDYVKIHDIPLYQQYSLDEIEILETDNINNRNLVGTYLSINKNCSNIEAAYDLIDFWVSDEEANKKWNMPYGRIANDKLYEQLLLNLTEEQTFYNALTKERVDANSEFRASFIGKYTMKEYFKEIYAEVAFGTIDLSEGSQMIYDKMESMLIN